MKLLRSLLCAVLLAFQFTPAVFAGWAHGGVRVPGNGVEVNVGSFELFGSVLNAMNTGNGYYFSGGANPAQIDANGYPAATLTSGQSIQETIGTISGQTQASTQWVFKWTPQGTGSLPFFFNAGWSNVSATGCTVSGSVTTTVNMTGGVSCRVTFNWTSPPGGFLVEFQAGAWGAQSDTMVLCRASDEAAITAGSLYTTEYLANEKSLHPHTIRTMGWIDSGGSANTNQSLFKYRSTLSGFGWMNTRFPPTVWGGNASGTNQYTVALPADSGTSGWVDGEVIQANIVNASTFTAVSISNAVAADASNCASVTAGLICLTVSSSAQLTTGQQIFVSDMDGTYEGNGVWTITVVDGTHIALQGSTFVNVFRSNGNTGLTTLSLTVTGKTGGTVFIATEAGAAPGAGFTSGSITTGIKTFVYDALLGVVRFSDGGINNNVPLEAQVALANAVNADLWTSIPISDNSNNYVCSEAALIGSSLNSWLSWHVEKSNENWNNFWPQAGYLDNQGRNLNGISRLGMQSFRHRQMAERAASCWTGVAANLVRVVAWQAFGDPTYTQTDLLNSAELNSATNAKLLAYAGSINYTTQGQRAVDFSEAGSYATYYSGALLQDGLASPYQTDGLAISQIQTLATAFNSNASDPTSLATLDNDFRQGTTSTQAISSISGTTINVSSNTEASSATTGAGGSGYTNGTQILTVSGGTCTIQPQFSVTVSGGIVTGSPLLVNSGECATAPANPASTTGGGGTGATLTVSYTPMYPNNAIGVFTVSSGGSLYSGVSLNTPYYVVNSASGSFSVAATQGGAAISLSGGSGTISFGVLFNFSMLYLANFIYPEWETVAASYDTYRTGAGKAKLWIDNYEGALEPLAPTTAQATDMGVTVGGSAATASTALANGLAAYKNSNAAALIALAQLNQVTGKDPTQPVTFGLLPHSRTPSWFLVIGPSQWSLLSGNLGSTAYQTYNGVAAFH